MIEIKKDMNNVKIRGNIITELLRLDHEGRKKKANEGKWSFKLAMAITKILRDIKQEFGSYVMVMIHQEASEAAGHIIAPFGSELLEDMINIGCVIKKI